MSAKIYWLSPRKKPLPRKTRAMSAKIYRLPPRKKPLPRKTMLPKLGLGFVVVWFMCLIVLLKAIYSGKL